MRLDYVLSNPPRAVQFGTPPEILDNMRVFEHSSLQELKATDLYIGVFWKRCGPYTIDESARRSSCRSPAWSSSSKPPKKNGTSSETERRAAGYRMNGRSVRFSCWMRYRFRKGRAAFRRRLSPFT